MNLELSRLVERLDNPSFGQLKIIDWGSPILSFGNVTTARIATVGLNPSNREFVDKAGSELNGAERRFHSLGSLGLQNWKDVKQEHLSAILTLCYEYFDRNPYDGWFKKLDYIISGTKMSYYFPSSRACHLDLIPYATSCKWTELSSEQKGLLLKMSSDVLGMLLNDSSIELIILNGKTVVDNLERISNVTFKKELMEKWTLPRKGKPGILGYGYSGEISKLGGVEIKRKIKVLGYNHNIQSSFGVTKNVQLEIRNWVTESTKNLV